MAAGSDGPVKELPIASEQSYDARVNSSMESKAKHLKGVTLEGLRSELKQFQRTILDEVWSHFLAKGEWPVLRHMYSHHEKAPVVECLSPLGASVVYEYEDSQAGNRCVLSLIGVLLTSEGPVLRTLLGRYFQFQWNLFKTDAEKTQVTAEELSKTLTLDDKDRVMLGRLLWLGHLGGSNRADGSWSAQVLKEVEDFRTAEDVAQYIEGWLFRSYRRDTPVFLADRQKQHFAFATSGVLSTSISLEDWEGDETPQPAVNSDPFKRRYQVFVSSTYVDLVQERQAVMHALLELDCIPSGMELFPAADDDQWTLIKRVIDDCDYYIVIIAGRYGSQAPHGISYTQMEYEYALSRNKPVIAFLHKNPTAISVQNFEQTDDGRKKLEDFRALAERKVCKYWATPDELGSVVSRSLIQLIKTKPAVGWVKGNLVAAESSAQELLKLRRRIEELQGMVPNEPDIRPIARRVEYYSTLAEAFPRNAIQETWSYVESTLRYVLLTHDLDNSGNFTQQIVDLFAHGDLDAERKESIVEFYELACRAKCDPAFKITTEEALKNIDEMIHFSKRLVESCDTLWNLRKAGTV